MQFISTFIALLAASSAACQKLNKTAAFPDLGAFSPRLKQMRKEGTRISAWNSTSIPKDCYDRIKLAKQDPKQFRAYTVHIDDCNMPWHVCRQNGSVPSIEGLVDAFARVPVGYRQFVGDIVHFKDGGGATAWKSRTLSFNGKAAESTSVWLHEASHCVDGANGIGLKSSDAAWRDAYNNDTHVADNYARTSHGENFAQYAGLVIYDRLTGGSLEKNYTRQWRQLKNQITTMAKAGDSEQSWGSDIFSKEQGKKCGRRWPHSEVVDPATGKKPVTRGCRPTRRRSYIGPREDGIVIMPSAEVLGEGRGASGLTNCTLTGGQN